MGLAAIALGVTVLAFVVQHALLLVIEPAPHLYELSRTVMLAAMVVIIGLAIYSRHASAGGSTMVDATTLQHVNVILSVFVLAGIFYLRDVELEGEPFRWYSLFLGVSVVLIVAEAGLREFLAGPTHIFHAVAVILLVVALYDPFDNRVRTAEWLDLMLWSVDATSEEFPAADRRILEVFASSGIVLTPELVSRNLDGIDEDVGERLEQLAEQRLVIRPNRRKFRITPLGERLVRRGNDVAQ